MSTKDKQTNLTAEEAIKILQEDNCVDCGYETESYAKCNFTGDCKVRNAMSMAIEALKAKPCTDAVSRQAVLDLINADWKYEGLESDVENLPPVTPQPKTAHWIHFANSDDCSGCGWSIGKYISPSDYCPKCGARMIEPAESEEQT